MSLAMSDYLEEQWLNHIFRHTTFPKPNTVALALLRQLPSDDAGTDMLEISMTGYQRYEVGQDTGDGAIWTDPSGVPQGETENGGLLDYGIFYGTGERIVGMGVMDDTGAGNLLFWGACATGWFPATVDLTTDLIHAEDHGLLSGERIFVRNLVGAAPLDQQVEYWPVDITVDDFKVALTEGGTGIDITTDGSCDVGLSNAVTVTPGLGVRLNPNTVGISLD